MLLGLKVTPDKLEVREILDNLEQVVLEEEVGLAIRAIREEVVVVDILLTLILIPVLATLEMVQEMEVEQLDILAILAILVVQMQDLPGNQDLLGLVET